MHSQPPHNLEAEQAVLARALWHPDAVDELEGVTENLFYSPIHKVIWQGIVAAKRAGGFVDYISVSEALKRIEGGDAVSLVYLTELGETVALPSQVAGYVELLKKKYTLRRVIATGYDMIANAHAEDEVAAIEGASRALVGLSMSGNEDDIYSCSTVCGETMAELMARAENPGYTGLQTGYHMLDAFTNGLQKSDLIYIAGRPSMGKTTFALNVARRLAVEFEAPGGIFSLEMSRQKIMEGMIASEARVDVSAVRSGQLFKKDWEKVHAASDRLSKACMPISDTAALKVGELKAKARRMKRLNGIQWIVIDYLQLMRADSDAQSREREISYISGELKALAKELDIPVLCLSQLNRSLEQRTNKRPLMSDLRDSGSIEQDADLILFLYRDDYYNRADDNPRKGQCEVIVGKNRTGRTGSFELRFRGELATFDNLEA